MVSGNLRRYWVVWEPVVSFGLRGFKKNSKSVGGYETQARWDNNDNGDDGEDENDDEDDDQPDILVLVVLSHRQ